MTKKIGISVVILLVTGPTLAQSIDTAWVRRYAGSGKGSDYAHAIAVDRSGCVYVTGESMGDETHLDYATIKYNPDGDTAWVRRYDGPANDYDYAFAIAVDSCGNVYVTGGSGSGGNHDYATVKYHPNGDTAWVRRYNGPGDSGDYACAIAVCGCGDVYVTGTSYGDRTGRDYATIKYDSSGNELWTSRYNGPADGDEWDPCIFVDGSGCVYVTGGSASSGGDFDFATVKYDSSGNEVWVQRYDGLAGLWDQAHAIAVDEWGNVYVTGYTERQSVSLTKQDYVTIKYDPSGARLWLATYNGPGNSVDNALALAVGDSGDVYVTGASAGADFLDQYATIRYYANGDIAWVRRYGGPEGAQTLEIRAMALAVDASGNVYVAGEIHHRATADDYCTVGYDRNGNLLWARTYNGPANANDRATAIAVDRFGNVCVTGKSVGKGPSWDYATIKYVSPTHSKD